MRTDKVISFTLARDAIRKFSFASPTPHTIYHVYPSLADYRGKSIPDGNNPRSHDEHLLTSKVAREIRDTLEESPDLFKNVNRGLLVIAADARYDDKSGQFTITLTDWERRRAAGEYHVPKHGLADGGTTDQVIANVQAAGRWVMLDDAQVHIEVMVFEDDSDDAVDEYLTAICRARNTSQQVKPWTMADFEGQFDWLKEILEARYKGLVAYEENDPKEVNILDVLAILNLFSPFYPAEKAPTASYSSKGSMMNAFKKRVNDFKALAPVVVDILEFHDCVYATFNDAYKDGSGKSLRRYMDEVKGTKAFREFDPPKRLHFSERVAPLDINRSLLYPMLAAFRALLDFNTKSTEWYLKPKTLWTEHGNELMERLLSAFRQHKKNPQSVGKDANIYRNLYDAVKIRRLEMQLSEQS